MHFQKNFRQCESDFGRCGTYSQRHSARLSSEMISLVRCTGSNVNDNGSRVKGTVKSSRSRPRGFIRFCPHKFHAIWAFERLRAATDCKHMVEFNKGRVASHCRHRRRRQYIYCEGTIFNFNLESSIRLSQIGWSIAETKHHRY